MLAMMERSVTRQPSPTYKLLQERFRAMTRMSKPAKSHLFIGKLAAALIMVVVAGCAKKENTPDVQVAVQASHPTVGSISEQISVDAVLTPLAQAAISPRITAPV